MTTWKTLRLKTNWPQHGTWTSLRLSASRLVSLQAVRNWCASSVGQPILLKQTRILQRTQIRLTRGSIECNNLAKRFMTAHANTYIIARTRTRACAVGSAAAPPASNCGRHNIPECGRPGDRPPQPRLPDPDQILGAQKASARRIAQNPSSELVYAFWFAQKTLDVRPDQVQLGGG
eukprot:1136811-Pelagomonas_calceolata.AAC.11